MNRTQQYLFLTRHFIAAYFLIWLFALIFLPQILIPILGGKSSFLAMSLPTMSVIPFMMVSQILAPDFLKTTAQINSVLFYQSSYLRAYAIDRPVITLSRLTIYWGVLFVVAFIILAACLFRPDLSLTAPSNSTMQILKENFPHATTASHTLTIPQAKLLQGGLFTVIMFTSAALLQAFTLMSAYFNFKKWIYWTGIALLFAAPLIVVVVPIFQDSRTTLSPDILLLLTFAHHWPIILALTALLVTAVNILTVKIDRQLESL